MEKPRFRPVFTPIGAITLVVALVILVRSLYARNPHEILLSFAVLLFMLALGFTGWWKAKKLELLEPGWKPPFPMTSGAGEETIIRGLGEPLPLFFRLHFIVRGKFFPTGGSVNKNNACPFFAETSVPRGEAVAHLALDFPMSGIFHGKGFCRLRDIFGLYSFPCGITLTRTINVRSAPCFGKKLQIQTLSGAEDRKTKNSTNEERFYMREYTPGDRLRDINWKSSEKIDALITRISPDNQEKINRIEIYFRNYGPEKPSLEALWLLDRAKSRLSYFLRNLMDENANFIFTIRSAKVNWEIQDSEDLEDFLEALAGLSFFPPQNSADFPSGTGNIYIFSTACDLGLAGFISACHPRHISLFITQPETVFKATQTKPKHETLYKRDFPAKGCVPLLRWLLRTKINPLYVDAGMVEKIYTETRL
ncbi:MAG: DUF58 domain-containing protein [Treponema sp.]|jgi:hypothetical protein|nr:DUF58 domain-containing protein [Treponema sp.]